MYGENCASKQDLAQNPPLPESRISGAGTNIVSPVVEFATTRTWDCYVLSGGLGLSAILAAIPPTAGVGYPLLLALSEPTATSCVYAR